MMHLRARWPARPVPRPRGMRTWAVAAALMAGCSPRQRTGWSARPDCTCAGADGRTVRVPIIGFIECEIPREQVVEYCNRLITPPPQDPACAAPATCTCTVTQAEPLACND
jgi:hypothetical protein